MSFREDLSPTRFFQVRWNVRGRDVPPDKLFSEINDNSLAILLTFGTTRVLLAGDAEKKAEEYMSNGPYTDPLAEVLMQ